MKMKTTALLILATLTTLLASCTSGSGSTGTTRDDSMPGRKSGELDVLLLPELEARRPSRGPAANGGLKHQSVNGWGMGRLR